MATELKMKKVITLKDLESKEEREKWWQEEIQECKHCYRIPGFNTLTPVYFTRKPVNCVDIGANVGTFSYYVSNIFKNIYSFEAMPVTFNSARENLKEKDNISLFNLAAAATTDLKIKIYKDISGLSGNSSIYDVNSTGEYDLVTTISLEDIIKKNKIDFIDYLKVDCEGAEFDLLMGKDLSKILFLTLEIHPGFIGEENSKELVKYLKAFFSLEFKIGNDIYFFKNKKR